MKLGLTNEQNGDIPPHWVVKS